MRTSPFARATFSYSQDPEKILLFTSSIDAAGGAQHTAGLFGDGRLIFKTLFDERFVEESIVRLSAQAVERLLRLCVDFGLAEWDIEKVHSKILEENSEKPYAALIPRGAPHLTMLISLKDYERGGYEVPRLEQKVRFRGAPFVDDRLPPILEIRGIVELERELSRLKKILGNQP